MNGLYHSRRTACLLLLITAIKVVFDLAYDVSSESSQFSRMESLYYNKIYSHGVTDSLLRQNSPRLKVFRRKLLWTFSRLNGFEMSFYLLTKVL